MKSMRRLFAMLLAIIMLLVNGSLAALAENVLSLPAALQVIGEEAFYGDTSIDKVVLPEGVTAIEARAFADSTLSEINLPASLTSIDDSAFDGPEQVTVTAQEGTYAYDWAVEHGYIREPMAWPESAHPYVDDGSGSEPWEYIADDSNAIALSATFSEETYFEENADFLYIIEADGRQNSYTGDQLAGATVVLPGDRFTLHLMKNGSVGAYGFRFEDIHVMSEEEYADYLAQQEAHAFDIRVRGDGTAVISGYSGSDAVLYIPAEIDGHAIVGIDSWAFANNSNITRVVIPNGVEYINYRAFYGCSNLTKVVIPGTVESIGGSAFEDCPRLSDVTLGEGIKEIGWQAFYNCESLTSIRLPASLTSIEYGAFDECPLETVEADEGTYAYFWAVENGYITPEGDFVVLARAEHGTLAHNGDDLILEYLSGNWEYIELLIRAQDEVTVQCTNECVEYYGDDYDEDNEGGSSGLEEGIVFPGQSSLSVYLKPNLAGAEREAVITFTCGEQTRTVTLRQLPHLLAEIVAPEGLGINMGYFDDITEPPRFFIPLGDIEFVWNTVEGAVSYSIGLSTPKTQMDSDDIAYFVDPGDIVDGQIRFTVTEDLLQPTGRMDNYIYLRVKDSHGYTYETPARFGVYDPASPEWGYKTYYAYDDETEEEYADGIVITGYMGDSTAPVVPSQINGQTVRALNGSMFQGLDITDITLPNTLYEITNCVFANLEHLPFVDIPEGVTYIGEEVFYNCTGLSGVSLPSTLDGIGYRAFSGCPLSAIDLPEGLTYIEDNAFYGCSGLNSIDIPEGVTNIWSETFSDCIGLMSVTLHEGLQRIDWGVFEGCTALTEISIPGSVTYIADNAFNNCTALTSFIAPEGSYAYNWGVEHGFIPEDYVFESAHPITSDGDFEYHYTHETEADGLKLTFSARSRFSGLSLSYDGGSDWYSGDWEGKNALAGKTVVIPGNHFDITLNVDSTGLWGFGITAIEPMTAEEITAWKDANPFLYEDYSQYDPNTYSWINGIRITKYQGSAAEVTVPATIDGKRVVYISGNTFNGRSDLTSVVVSEGVLFVDAYAFSYCSALTSVTLPGSITQINGDSIYGSSNLVITAPEGSYAWNWAQENGYGIENAVLESTHPFYSDEAVEYEYNGPADAEMLKVTFSKRTYFCNGMRLTQSDGSISDYYGDSLAGKTLYLPGDHFTITLYPVNEGSDPYFGFRITDVTPMSVAEYETYRTEHPFTTRSWGDDLAITGYIGPDTDLVIPEYYEGKRVVYIDYQAFYDHDELTRVVIPDSVSAMSSAVFDSCSNLVSVTLPSGMWYINNNMFSGCTSLAEIEIPDNVQSISNYVFYNCKSLTSLALSGNVSSIEDDAFQGCTNLTITAPEGSFAWNWAMEHGYMYEESVLESDHPYTPESEHTFTYVHPEPADSLKVTFSVRTEVGNAWITDVNGHTVNYYGDTLKGRTLYFPGNSFTMQLDEWSSDCFGFRITDITPMTAEEYDAYRAENPFETNPWNDGVQITNYIGADTSLVIPSTIDGKTVYYLGYQAFANNTELTSVVIPDSVTGMDSYVFENCTGLTSVTLPGSLHSITNDVFRGCSALEEVIIPDGIQNIYHYAFYGCTSLTSLYLPASVNNIDDTAFYGCTNLTITAPEGSYAYNWAVAHGFAGGTTPTSEPTNTPEPTTTPGTAILESDHPYADDADQTWTYVHPESAAALRVTFSQDTLFEEDCDYLYITDSIGTQKSYTGNELSGAELILSGNSFTLRLTSDSSVNEYGFAISDITALSQEEYDAYLAENLYEYHIMGDGTVEISGYNGTNGVVTLPTEIDGYVISGIGMRAFMNSALIAEVTIPEGMEYIGSMAFYGCTNLTKVVIPGTVKRIGGEAFYGCTSLNDVTLGEGIERIEWDAFANCTALTSITLPESLKFIDFDAFSDSGLSNVTAEENSYAYVWAVDRGYITPEGELVILPMLENGVFTENGDALLCDQLSGGWVDVSIIVRAQDDVTMTSAADYLECYDYNTGENADLTTGFTVLAESRIDIRLLPNLTGATRDTVLTFTCGELTRTMTLRQLPYLLAEIVAPAGLGVDQRHFDDDAETPRAFLELGDIEFAWSTVEGATRYFVGVDTPGHYMDSDDNAAYVEINPEDIVGGVIRFTVPAEDLRHTGRMDHHVYLRAVDAYGYTYDTPVCFGVYDAAYPEWGYRDYEVYDEQTGEEYTDGLEIIGYMGSNTAPTVPGEIDGQVVKSIGDKAFEGSDITGITLPNTLIQICEEAFTGCDYLTSVDIPEGVTSIYYSAFGGCDRLASVTLPNSLTYLDGYTFCNCPALTTIVIPDGVTSVSPETFSGCTGLQSVTLPEGIDQIGWAAFEGCTALTEIGISANVTYIDDTAFNGCTNLTITAPEGSYAYNWAVSHGFIQGGSDTGDAILESSHPYPNNADQTWGYVHPESAAGLRVTFSADTFFEDSYDYLYITGSTGAQNAYTGSELSGAVLVLPGNSFTLRLTSDGSVTEHGFAILDITGLTQEEYEALQEPPFLTTPYRDGVNITGYTGTETELYIPETIDGLQVYNIDANAFEGNETLNSVYIPDTVEYVYERAFKDCTSLTRANLPSGMENIQYGTFQNCTSLADISLPENTRIIYNCAFQNCESLTYLYLPASITAIENNAFDGCTNLTIIAPEGSFAYSWAQEHGFIGQSSLLPAPVLTLTEEEPASDLWMAVMLDQSYDEVRAWRYKDGQPIYGDDATIWTNTDHIGYFQFEPGEYRFVVDCRKGGAWTEQAEITFTVVDGYIDKLRPAPALVMVPAEPKPGDWTTIFLGQRYDTIRALGYMNDQPMYDGEATIWEDNYCIGAFQYEPGDYRFLIDCMKNGGWTEQAEITFSVSENAGGSLLPAPTLTLDPTAPTSENWTSIHLDQTYDEVRAWAYKNGELHSDETIWYNTNHIGAFQYEYGRYLYIVDCRKGGSWTERATITFTVAWGEELEPAPWILDPS